MKNYCELEECLALKELGFKERVIFYFEGSKNKVYSNAIFGWDFNTSFSDCCSRPSYEEAFEFFEKEFNLYVEIGIDKTLEPKYCYNIGEFKEESLEWECISHWSWLFYTRAEAKK